MKKSFILFLISFLFVLGLTFFSGCVQPSPAEPFNSLQKLKDSIGSADIYFPDVTGYVFTDGAKYYKIYKGKSNILVGYSFGDKIDASKSDTGLFCLYCSCDILNVYYDERNPAPPLEANIIVLGTDVNENIHDESDDPNIRTLQWYSVGSKVFNYSYQFDFNGCRYYISGTLVITKDKLNDMATQKVESMTENVKNEVMGLVKSVIEQGK